MSRLSDLLNPVPQEKPPPPPIDTSHNHNRNPSLSTPLQALALGADRDDADAGASNDAAPHGSASEAVSKPQAPDSTRLLPIDEASTKSERMEVDSSNLQKETDIKTEEATGQGTQDAPKSSGITKELPPKISTSANASGTESAAQSPTVLPSTEGNKKKAAVRADKKKGTASVIKKPAAKKRKIESAEGTPFSPRSATPASSRASKTPAPRNRKQNSNTPARSSPARSGDDDGDDGGDDGELFCVCRKPDDHTWMIGCDGGCEDWFHGHCVGMKQEDAELIDTYICPNCAKGGMVTTWKPMCRLDGCRKPARVEPPNPSKYCCDEHGEEFMRRRVMAKDGRLAKPPPKKKRATAQEEKHEDEDEDDDQPHLKGGVLRPGELKALASGVASVEEFRRLGDSAAPRRPAGEPPDERDAEKLAEIEADREDLEYRLEMLRDKDRLLTLVKSRAASIVAELNKRLGEVKKKDAVKDLCGFDPRLAWSDDEFDAWRKSDAGRAALESGTLQARDDGDVDMANGAETDIAPDVCQKKRCERHKAWFKLQQQEVVFERNLCREKMAKLEREAQLLKGGA